MAKAPPRRRAPSKSRTFWLRVDTVARLERRARQEQRSPNEIVQQVLDARLPGGSVVEEVAAIAREAGARRRGPMPKFDRDAQYDDGCAPRERGTRACSSTS